MKHLLMAMFASLLASPSALAVTEAELEQTLSRLMTTLPGEFDSAAQMQAEEATNTLTDMIHGNVYRSFIRISAPAVGENLLVSTVRYGGRDGRFDNGEFQVMSSDHR